MSFPAAFNTAEGLLIAINNFATTCVGVIDNVQTSIVIASAAGLPPSGVISIDSEVIRYQAFDASGDNFVLLNCDRGYDGTSPTQHGSGSKVELRWVAAHHNRVVQAILDLEAALGLGVKGGFTSLTELMANSLPVLVQKNSSTTWTFTHTRKRVVAIQLYRQVSTNNYEKFDAVMSQAVDPGGTSTVTITLSTAEAGYVVYQ